MSRALVSIIIPAYNYASYLKTLFKSVFAQTYQNFEVILVDDGSTDETKSLVLENFPAVRYIYQANQGVSAARNTGIRAAEGEYLLFLDADDILTPNVLETQVATLDNNPKLDISVCLALFIYFTTDTQFSTYIFPLKADNFDLHLCCSNINTIHSFCIRKDKLDLLGLFQEKMSHLEDYEFWLRCVELGLNFGLNLSTAVFYRQHQDSSIHTCPNQFENNLQLRQQLSNFLETKPDFPKTGKLSGWLAHLTGCLKVIKECPLDNKIWINLWREARKAFYAVRANSSSFDVAETKFVEYYTLEAIKALQVLEVERHDLLQSCQNMSMTLAKIIPWYHHSIDELERALRIKKFELTCDDQTMRKTAQAAILWLHNEFLKE